MIRKANKEKKWLNNADFLALIKFKKLGTNEKNLKNVRRPQREIEDLIRISKFEAKLEINRKKQNQSRRDLKKIP